MNLRLDEELIERTKLAAKDAGESLTQYAATALLLRLDPPVIGKLEDNPRAQYVRGPGISQAPPVAPKAPKEVAEPIIAKARDALTPKSPGHQVGCWCAMCKD